MAQDVAIVLWLMSVSPNQVQRALRCPDWGLAEVDRWYSQKDMAWCGSGFSEALAVYSEVMAERMRAVMDFNAASAATEGGQIETPPDESEAVGKSFTGPDSSASLPAQLVSVSAK
jgi:hypothetical protein